jgi:ABC-type lipoprotein release transport system permease subunit
MQLIKLAWRSIWRNRRRTIITICSISLGLLIAVFFIAFAEGVYEKMTDDAVRMLGGHVTLEHPEYRDAPAVDMVVSGLDKVREAIEKIPEVERTKAVVLGQGVIKSGLGAVGVAVLGIEPSAEKGSSPMAKRIVAGAYLEDEDGRKVIVGKQLAKRLKLGKKKEAKRISAMFEPYFQQFGVKLNGNLTEAILHHFAVGKKVVITSTNVQGELTEELLRVKGIFEVGAAEIDGYMIQIPIGTAQKLYGMGSSQATQLGVVVRNPDSQAEVLGKVKGLAGGKSVDVLPWEEVMPDLATYIEIDGGSNYVFQGIIIFLIMFTIFNTILMSVLERKREFAVVLALGTPPRKLRSQIILETAMIGLLGVVLGLVLGGGVTAATIPGGIDISALYEGGVSVSGFAIEPIIRPKLTWELLAWLGGLVFGATMLLGLYPMRKSTKIELADLLR